MNLMLTVLLLVPAAVIGAFVWLRPVLREREQLRHLSRQLVAACDDFKHKLRAAERELEMLRIIDKRRQEARQFMSMTPPKDYPT